MKKQHYILFALSLMLSSSCKSPEADQKQSNNAEEQVDGNQDSKQDLTAKRIERGIDFVAYGNEPFWTVELDFEQGMHLFGPGVEREMHTPLPDRMDLEKGFRYHAEVESGNLTLEVYRQVCTDQMSGSAYPYTVRCISNGKEYLGCGEFIVDEKELEGTWVLLKMDEERFEMESESQMTLRFDFEQAVISGSDGCNNFFGAAEISHSRLHLPDFLGSTQKACEDMKTGDRFKENLKAGSMILQAEDGKMAFTGNGHRLVFTRK